MAAYPFTIGSRNVTRYLRIDPDLPIIEVVTDNITLGNQTFNPYKVSNITQTISSYLSS